MAKMTIGQELIQSMEEAVAYTKGARKGFKVHTFRPDDVRLIRAQTRKSQAEFAKSYGLPLRTLQKWESGATHPTGPAATLLRVIRANPKAVERALEKELAVA
jgi:putative transcriptional regulator